MKKLPFEGKIIWITGASRGIGAALAVEYAKQGAHLILSAPKSEIKDTEEVRQRCPSSEKHRVLPFDLTEPAAIKSAVAEALSGGLSIDVLVNNAGATHRSLILDTSAAVDRKIMEINFFGPILLTELVAHSMTKSGGGQVVFINSVNGLLATPMRAAYVASKHALTGWSESFRAEMASHQIDVTVVHPGFVKTDIAVHALTGDGGRYGKQGAQGNAMSPEKVAKRVVAATLAREQRLIVAGKEKLLIYLGKVSPWLVTQIIRRVSVT